MLDNDISASTNETAARRRRYERTQPQDTFVALTPVKLTMLRFLAELRFLSLPQLAQLCCPSERKDLSQKSARRHLRALFDAGLVDVLPISRAALALPGSANDASLLYGSAPNVYTPTVQALRLLRQAGMIGEEILKRPAPAYGPRNSLFLTHELAVRDVRVWLELSARAGGHEIECWKDGEEAAIGLGRGTFSVRPDAWFVLRLGSVVLVGLVEVDRGTERGDRRWGGKLTAYADLFADRSTLSAATGYVNARVLVLVPNTRRRDGLASFLAYQAREAYLPTNPAERFWLAEHGDLAHADLTAHYWYRPGSEGRWPLVSARSLDRF